MLPRTSRNTCWIVDSFTQVKLAKHMVKSKTKSISNRGAFSSFNVQSIIFSKFLHEYWSGSRDGSYLFRYGVKESAKLQNMHCVRAQIMHLSMSCWRKGRQGMGWGFDCLCWPWLILFSHGREYLNPSSPDVEIFDCRLGRKRLRPNIRFPLPRFTHASYGLKRSGSHGGQWEQAKAEWISLFCLQISFVLACFWSIEPLKILWYQSKRK